MKIVFMEAQSLGEDMDLSIFSDLGEVIVYDTDTPEKNGERIRDADIVVMNKIIMNEELLKVAENVKLICITATGTDCVDVAYAAKRGIAVSNVRNYSTESVVQHTFALLFYLLEKLCWYDDFVKSGEYAKVEGFGCYPERFRELFGMTWGIIGLGNIGKRVAEVARVFGCRVIYYSTSGQNSSREAERVDFDTLLQQSDVISIHAPLNEKTERLIDERALKKMKKSAILLNLGRGGIVDNPALTQALEQDRIAAAGLDVLDVEPITSDNPLNRVKDSRKLLITPHIAWAAVESRKRCVEEVYKNIESFQKGVIRNGLRI